MLIQNNLNQPMHCQFVYKLLLHFMFVLNLFLLLSILLSILLTFLVSSFVYFLVKMTELRMMKEGFLLGILMSGTESESLFSILQVVKWIWCLID